MKEGKFFSSLPPSDNTVMIQEKHRNGLSVVFVLSGCGGKLLVAEIFFVEQLGIKEIIVLRVSQSIMELYFEILRSIKHMYLSSFVGNCVDSWTELCMQMYILR